MYIKIFLYFLNLLMVCSDYICEIDFKTICKEVIMWMNLKSYCRRI